MADRHEVTGGVVAAGPAADAPVPVRRFRYGVGFFAAAVVTAALLLSLPFSLKGVVEDVLGPSTGRAIQITPRVAGPVPEQHMRLLLA